MFHIINPYKLLAFSIIAVYSIKSDKSHEETLNWAWSVGYNQSCGHSGISCEVHFICSSNNGSGKCTCPSQTVYIPTTNKCWSIPNSEHNGCKFPIQCQSGSFGKYSRCNVKTEKCECVKIALNQKVVLLNGVCVLQKESNEITAYNKNCQFTKQCQDWGLGSLGICNGLGKCDCSGNYTLYYNKLDKCFLRKQYFERCQSDEECQANLGPKVKCGRRLDERETTCFCPTGRVCRDQLGTSSAGILAFNYYQVKFCLTLVATILCWL